MSHSGPARVSVGRARVHRLGFAEAVEAICGLVGEGKASTVVTPNIQHVALLERDQDFRQAYESAALVLPDGWPIVVAMSLRTGRLSRRVTGADLVPALCRQAAERGLTVGFVGGAPGAAIEAERRMRREHPGLRCVLIDEPPWGFEQDPGESGRLIAAVNMAGPDILFVGLGTPKQELFIAAHQDKLNVGVVVCSGAAIDFIAGCQRRAPRWLRNVGLEWAYRVAREPRRLAGRYAAAAPRFLIAVARDVARVLPRRSGPGR